MPIWEVVIGEIVKLALGGIADKMGRQFTATVDLEPRLQNHLAENQRWASEIQVLDMRKPAQTKEVAVPLAVNIPRQFHKSDDEPVGQSSLLSLPHHVVLLGDPGSGKTTAIKQMFLSLLEEPVFDTDLFQYPIVIRLRELGAKGSIYMGLAAALGFQGDLDFRAVGSGSYECFLGNHALDEVIPNLLNATSALIFFDGLDEVARGNRQSIESEINKLSYALSERSKIILTCRYGEYNTTLQGFEQLAIAPLNQAQIEDFANRWSNDPVKFLADAESATYNDLRDRPLFLAHMVLLHNVELALPDRPIDVYRKLVELVLEKWDMDNRREKRESSIYAGFDAARKLEFLSALSHALTYKIKTKSFSQSLLEHVYSEIREDFALPQDQAAIVAKEIESHNGLIMLTSEGAYEFSHLTFQEYLCGYHLARAPVPTRVKEYLREYPAPLAIAAAISSDPTRWISMVLNEVRTTVVDDPSTVEVFLTRLDSERVVPKANEQLGCVLISLLMKFEGDSDNKPLYDTFIRLLSVEPYGKSASKALRMFRLRSIPQKSDNLAIQRRQESVGDVELELTGRLPIEIFEKLAADFDMQMTEKLDSLGREIVLVE